MAGGRFAKQATFRGALFNSNNTGDAVIGGALSVAPAGSNIGSQAWQNYPGDRIIFSPLDALATQNNNVGNLYTGTYRYVATANSVVSAAVGVPAFWVPVAFNNNQAQQDALYQTTPDQLNNYGVSLFAGVYLNNPGKNNYWWIQESGKVRAQFDAMTGATAAIGAGVYLNAAGNNNNQAFTQINGANLGAGPIAAANFATTLDGYITRFVGVAEQLPSNNNISVIDLVFRNGGFRW